MHVEINIDILVMIIGDFGGLHKMKIQRKRGNTAPGCQDITLGVSFYKLMIGEAY